MKNIRVDVLVIGAGPAGCIAASILKKRGHDVIVVEKQKFPRFVIGESLLPRVMDHLEEAGLLEAVIKVGFQKKTGAIFVQNDKFCEFDFKEQFSNGWNWTWQVTRADLDSILATEVQRKGVGILFETSVESIEFSGTNSTTLLETATGENFQIDAKYIIDASGYGRVIPRMFNLEKPSAFKPRETLFAHIVDSDRPIDDKIVALILDQNTWAWIIPFSNGNTSVGIVSDSDFFKKFTGSPLDRLVEIIRTNSFLSKRFPNPQFVFEPKTISGYSVSVKQLYGEGYVLAGNATEFLDPIFSSGVTLAMESGNLAAKLTSEFLNGKRVDWERDYSEYVMQGINVFRTYVQAWYDGSLQEIFFTKEPDVLIKKQICSVLAGYVWDLDNPFVKKHEKAVKSLASFLRHRKE